MIDLHIHSNYSDGSSTPKQILEMAVAQGLTTIALTDHDTVAGLSIFLEHAGDLPIRAITGIELSGQYGNGSVHILGYKFNHQDSGLLDSLQQFRKMREERNPKIIAKLNALGFTLTMEDVLGAAQVKAGERVKPISRVHIAEALVRLGYFERMDQVFDKLIGEEKPAFVNKEKFTPRQSIAIIHHAGGLAFLAHPGQLHLDNTETEEVILEMKAAGIDGIEAYHPEHNPEFTEYCLSLARNNHLLVSGGSDYHGQWKPTVKLGVGKGSLCVPDSILEQW